MAANKRTPAERERDQEQLATLWCKGWTHLRIAGEFGVSRPQITQDLAKLLAKWAASAVGHVEERIAAELKKLDHLEGVAWDAWERSCRDAVSTHVRTESEGAVDAAGRPVATKTVQEKTIKPQAGDPRFLERAGWCIDRRCGILGLDSPKKIAPTNPEGDSEYAGGGTGALLAAVLRVAAEIGVKPTAEPPPDG